MLLTLPDADSTRNLGKVLGERLPGGSVILLEGNLGSGKTTLVQGMGEGLGISEAIDSPTFTLINEYFGGRVPLYHLDLYRLEGEEIEGLNLDIYWEGMEVELGIVAIEWADKLEYKPSDYLSVNFREISGEGREVELRVVGEFLDLNMLGI
ncbi:MAG: tRNA (adenosine(37)-N6)-threonylcarbamoyltransferase complex ATPase subunit type 1 TsaE [Okeania sp. SIO2H7]|nr:tRNA (adenosine(37)-N6)-threonylcarbamoyltransferase complex ATPase subunit type 1 TsaE [Okeania sp. SIO2H7]